MHRYYPAAARLTPTGLKRTETGEEEKRKEGCDEKLCFEEGGKLINKERSKSAISQKLSSLINLLSLCLSVYRRVQHGSVL